MPQILVRTSHATVLPTIAAGLAAELTTLMVNILARKRESVVIGFEPVDGSFWFSGGSAPGDGSCLIQAVITVLTGTGSQSEREIMIQRTDEALRKALGPAHGPVYVLFQDVPPESWGYNGKSVAAIRAK